MQKYIFTILLIIITFAIAQPVLALPSIVPPECQGDAPISQCNLSSVEKALLYISQIILGTVGSLILALFVYGGIRYITSGGSTDKIKKATDVLKYATIGLAIILLSGVIVKLVLTKLTTN